MRRLMLILVPALAALAVLAAPALSLQPWRPGAVDFELALPASALAPAPGGRGGWVSEVIEPSRRFDLVGLRWEQPPEGAERGAEDGAHGEHGAEDEGHGEHADVYLRTRAPDGTWSAWVPVGAEHGEGASDGVWAGGAEAFQVRFAGVPPRGLSAHLVNTTGSSTASARATTAVRGAVSTAVLATVGKAVAWAQGSGRPPAITPREAWAGEDCKPRSAPSVGRVELGFVHHTVSTNNYAPGESAAVILAICRYHRNSLKWDDIGYNFLVDRWGRIYEGRAGGTDQPVVGAQTQGFNGVSTGVAAIGTYSSVTPPGQQVSAIASLLAWKLPHHGVPTTGTVTVTSQGGAANRFAKGQRVTLQRISTHRDAGKTTCAGDGMVAQLPGLRAMAAERQQPLNPSPPESGTGTNPGGGAGAVPVSSEIHPSKLQILRADIERARSVLDVHAPITARASGTAEVELYAAQRRHTFRAPVDSANRRINFREAIPRAQARLGTGILTIRYPGDADTRTQELRLRAANGRSNLELERPTLQNGVLAASGTINPRASGVVRVSVSYVHQGRTYVIERQAPIADGSWSLSELLPPADILRIAQRTGTVHSTTAYTGDFDARLRGEARSFRVLGAR